MSMPDLIANWPAPRNISALTTTRTMGSSVAPYAGNNLAMHVGDNPEHVQRNRNALVTRLALPNEPAWLDQTHTNHCVIVEDNPMRAADAAITRSPKHPLAIMTADCLPILLCDRAGSEIAAIHAGWRGLLNGIVENTLNKMHAAPETLLAWIGPAICQQCYATGSDVRDAYIKQYSFTEAAFDTQGSAIHANLPKMAELILIAAGVTAVYQSGACSFEQTNEFYSYRHATQTGRMASLIWFNQG